MGLKTKKAEVNLVPVPPDGGWGWMVVIASFLIHVIADGFVYSFGTLADDLIKEFNASNATTSLIISVLTGLTLGSGPLASAICNKYGCRVTTITGAVISLIGCFCAFMSYSIYHIMFSVGIVMGIGFGLMYCPAIVVVTMYFERWRSLATGIAVSGAGVGTVVFAPINVYLSTNYGWRYVFVATGVAIIICFFCGLVFRPLKFELVSDEPIAIEPKNEPIIELTTSGNRVEPDQKRFSKESTALLSPVSEPGEKNVEVFEVRPARSLTHLEPDEEGQAHIEVGERESGFINRKDVFYTGSIHDVEEFREHPVKYRSTGSLSKEQIAARKSIGSEDVVQDVLDTTGEENISRTVNRMLDLSLLADPKFLLFSFSNLLTSVGFNSPLYFLPLHAEQLGLSKEQGSSVLAFYGIFNTVGRLLFGLIADHRIPLPYGIGNDTARNRLWIYNVSLAICGIITMICYMFNGFFELTVYGGLFGFTIASYVCLTSVILVDLLGLEKLTNAFGLLLLWQGVGTVVGPPISGYLADITGNYVMSFVFCGANLFISGIMLFALLCCQKRGFFDLDTNRKTLDQKY
ncbi:unnamed protein product [Caenorhabditis auriculariae]|uniref:Major facilitator superfamily (MFS) profile domain-containing protein n=1 Tax=Caenorhabditis auriculariae TaxID=2777116 RepID=A0A8S1HHG4_9PELO|nr:unnamed protein product [Caenorhabditis auriculariae]